MANFINPTNFNSLIFSGEATTSVAVSSVSEPHPISKTLSGVILNQNQFPVDNTDQIDLTTGEWVYQEFLVPDDFPRGQDNLVPDLTGLQIFVDVENGYEDCATLDWKLEHYEPGVGWSGAGKGIHVGSPHASLNSAPDQGVWITIYFKPLDVKNSWKHRWRFAIRGRSGSGVVKQPVDDYDGKYITIGSSKLAIVPAIASGPLEEGKTYPFDLFGVPSLLHVEPGSGAVSYSTQQGFNAIWYSAPNPLTALGRTRAYEQDGVNPIKKVTEDVSIMFRVLASVADDGVDFLGNVYRGIVTHSQQETLNEANNSFWLSKPNPSRFAVENLYFDLRDGEDPVIVDHVVLDPITPNVWFHVYYSNDPVPGTTPETWDNLLWERVPDSFHAHRKNRFTLPRPISAKYIKIEFSHLQARSYSPGQFEKPVVYHKHPKWVLDYFLQLYRSQIDSENYVRRTSTLRYDLLDLAFNYFIDDIRNFYAPFDPVTEEDIDNNLFDTFISAEADLVDQVDPDTLSRITALFRPFLRQPFDSGKDGFILSDYAFLSETQSASYSTESIIRDSANTTEVSSMDREQVVIEKNFPVMSFPIQCRHKYRKASASFINDIGYFAGVKEIAFTRDHYSSKHDHTAYIESAGDNVNVESNDFETVDFNWVTYATS